MPSSPKVSAKLSGAALRQLRALGHALSPVVAIGKEGLTDSVVAAVDSAIGTHELVKVKIQREAPVDRHEAAIELAARTGSVLAQAIGRTVLLYRRNPKKPKIVLADKAAKRDGGAKKAKSAKAQAPVSRPATAEELEEPVDSPEDEAGDL